MSLTLAAELTSRTFCYWWLVVIYQFSQQECAQDKIVNVNFSYMRSLQI